MNSISIFWVMIVTVITVTTARAQPKTPLAITIDDLPGLHSEDAMEVNRRIIEVLQTNQWPAIGFVNEAGFYQEGELDSGRLEILHHWLQNGYELGNHTYSHINYHKTDTTTYFRNIMKGETLTRPLSEKYGLPYRYFRHPYLRNGQTAEKKSALNDFLRRNQYEVAPVTIDNAEWIYAQAYRKAKQGGDPVMQDSIARSYITYMVAMSNYYRQQAITLTGRDIPHVLLIHVRGINADLLEELIKRLEEEDFEVADLEGVLKDDVYQREDGYFGGAGISWVERWAKAESMPSDFYTGMPRCPQFVQDYAGLTE